MITFPELTAVPEGTAFKPRLVVTWEECAEAVTEHHRQYLEDYETSPEELAERSFCVGCQKQVDAEHLHLYVDTRCLAVCSEGCAIRWAQKNVTHDQSTRNVTRHRRVS